MGHVVGAAARGLGRGVLVELRGPLGAGKTTLSQGIGTGMGLDERVTSPTFALVHEHGLSEGIPIFVHVDLYRTDSEDEVRQLALDEALDAGAIVAVEWPEQAGAVLREATDEVLTIRVGPCAADEEVDITVGKRDAELGPADPDRVRDVEIGFTDTDRVSEAQMGDRPRRLDFEARGAGAERILESLSRAIESAGAERGVRRAGAAR